MTEEKANKYDKILETYLSKEDYAALHPIMLGGIFSCFEVIEATYGQHTEPVSLKRFVMAMNADEISRIANEKIKADQRLNGMEIEHEVLPAHTRFILEAIKEELP